MKGKLPIRRNKFTDEAVHQYGGNGAKVESFWNRGREIVNRLCAGSEAEDGRERSVCMVQSEKSL